MTLRIDRSYRNRLILAGALILMLVVGALLIEHNRQDPGKRMATAQCATAVESRLKSPASAEYSNVSAVEHDDGTWTLSGTVDAANAYGTPMRHRFSCRDFHLNDALIKNVELRQA